MKVTVLYGGPSSEREVSLKSGKAVADGLKAMGHDVLLADIMPNDLSALNAACDVVFPVLHGQWGESGELQAILELRALPFVGSGSQASRLGMEKTAAKECWRAMRLATPDWYIATTASQASLAVAKIGLPCVVKAVDGGSSIDVFLCDMLTVALESADKLIAKHGRCMVEQMIRGKELTVGIIDQQALPPIWISATGKFYDFQAKYNADTTRYNFQLGLGDGKVRQIQQLAFRAHQALGCRHLSRVDVMLDANDNPYLLEINTLPGFTDHSLLPKAARYVGLEFGPLVDKLARLGAGKRAPVMNVAMA